MVPFSFIAPRRKTLIDSVTVKETYDHPMQGISRCVDSPLTWKATAPVQKP
jgi:hypothetical protein